MTEQLALSAERSVLGGVMILCEPWGPELEALRPGDFGQSLHAQVFAAMLALRERQEPVDQVTVHGELAHADPPKDQGWATYLGRLASEMPIAANLGHYATIVRREARRREIALVLATAAHAAREEGADGEAVLSEALAELGRIADGRELVRPVSARELVNDEWSAMQTRAAGTIQGVTTGYASLDQRLGGLPRAGLTVIAARPSMGKSSLARNVLCHQVLRAGMTGLLFSFEMSREEIIQAMLAAEASCDLSRIRTSSLRTTDWGPLAEAAARLSTEQLMVVDRADLKISDVRSIARAANARRKLDVVVVDYLQLVEGGGETREQEVASICRGLRALASELRVPVIALSQLNRSLEQRGDKRPQLSDLRESGAIEQDAHQVLFVYRDEYYDPDTDDKGIAEIAIGKNRNGPTGAVRLRWMERFTRFDPFEKPKPNPQTELPYGGPGAES